MQSVLLVLGVSSVLTSGSAQVVPETPFVAATTATTTEVVGSSLVFPDTELELPAKDAANLGNLGLNSSSLAADVHCAMNAGEAVDHLVHSVLYVWAASQRCGSDGAPVTCEIDVMSTIHSVSSLANSILKVLEGCGHMDISMRGYECGKAVNVLTSSSTGLAAAVGGLARRCPDTHRGTAWQQQPKTVTEIQPNKCIVDVGKIVSSGFRATKELMAIKQICTSVGEPSQTDCSLKSISIVSLIADVAAFIASSVRDCGGLHGMGVKGVGWAVSDDAAGCGNAVLETISRLSDIAVTGMSIPDKCDLKMSLPTLKAYNIDDDDSVAPRLSSAAVTIALAAVLPIAMVFSFFGGSRFAKSQMKSNVMSRPVPDAYQGIFGDVAVGEENLGLSFADNSEQMRSPSMARTPRFTPRPV